MGPCPFNASMLHTYHLFSSSSPVGAPTQERPRGPVWRTKEFKSWRPVECPGESAARTEGNTGKMHPGSTIEVATGA